MSGELRADPAVLSATCQSLSGAAQHLLERLKSLDGNVTSMLANWQGSSGGSYGDAWKMWHTGADEVEKALAIMADLLGHAGKTFASQEQANAAEVRGVYGG
ncbi:WXG100 family type VII secretion target [Mycolicibacterium psychrotolerans]|uniref:WXG100 family type VII secretion target n=1 Tax=Mycolicibacterium psychrotolerans TaxID=216929 RepID=UPI003D6779C0